jgi:hypothetical protein
MTTPKVTTQVKTISGLERLRNSPSGNPHWKVSFADGVVAQTPVDAALNFQIDPDALVGQWMEIAFDANGEVIGIAEIGHNFHKAAPSKSDIDVEQPCKTCGLWVKKVPDGHGPTWVHSETGAVVAPGPERR